MAVLDLATCEAKLQEYLDAETTVLKNQSYTLNGRQLTRANLAEIQKGIEAWNTRVIQRTPGRRAVKRMGMR